MPKFHYIFQAIHDLLSKKAYINFIKISSIRTHLWKHYTQGHNFFIIIFVPNKMFKNFFTKKSNVRYYYSIHVCNINWDRALMLMKCYPDSSPADIFPTDISSKTFPRRTVTQRTVFPTDSSPKDFFANREFSKWHFPERTFPRTDISQNNVISFQE